MDFLFEAAVLLGAAIIAVPLFQRLGLGSILGYLAAGLVLGPSISGFIAEPETVLHFAEFGVVMLLFVIGLELEPARLWTLRKRLLGLGSLQLAGCAALLTPLGLVLGLTLEVSVLLGLILALSSTAFALQVLNERHQLASPHGQAIIDPAVYRHYPEVDLAMLTLFGAPGAAFFEAYWDADEPSDWPRRQTLFQLYPLLNHLLLFGAGYRSAVTRSIAELA
ncbi:MAG: cation:proton antiporter [Pseudomonadota bacterium]|nr:cation:proton antiporter [Pseudomonadota bacterium]